MFVIGANEIDAGTISVRHRRKGDLGAQNPGQFLEQMLQEINEKQLD